MRKYNVAIIGATGMVGREMLKIIHDSSFPVNKLRLFASIASAGTKLSCEDETYIVEKIEPGSFTDVDIALISAGGNVSREIAPQAVSEGAVVIDNSSAFRMDVNVPLVVTEVNAKALRKHDGIIANPNCSTIQLVVMLKPIQTAFGLKKVIVSTYQSVSGAGKNGVDELIDHTDLMLKDKKTQPNKFPVSIAFNVIPQIGEINENGDCFEEVKMMNETKKILANEHLQVAVTTVRVPVMIGHSEAVYFQTEKETMLEDIISILSQAKGIKVYEPECFPTALDSQCDDDVLIGRLRSCLGSNDEFLGWIVANNLRKGAALNAVQIAEYLIREDLL
jgi:aspartate-semialdehyde dehydrogenase